MTTVRHVITALVLLIALLAGVEVWMRSQAVPTIQIVSSQTSAADQALLIPSEVCHHELRRNSAIQLSPAERRLARVIRVNSVGCRGDEVEIPAKDGTYRILVLGDDSVCGTWVDENETIAARLQRFLSKESSAAIEVINGGVPGYCPLLSWLRFENGLAELKPQLVILHVDMTDVADDACYRSLTLSKDNQKVCPHATFRLTPRPENALMQYARQSATATWLFAKTRQHGPELLSVSSAAATCDVGLHWIADDPPDLRLQVRHALAPIKDLHDAVVQSGGQLLVTTSPVLWQVLSADEAPELSRCWGIKGVTPFTKGFPFEVLSRFCEQSRIHYCDASPAFRCEGAEKLFSRDAPVLSRIGMALYAREVAQCLITDPPSKWSDRQP